MFHKFSTFFLLFTLSSPFPLFLLFFPLFPFFVLHYYHPRVILPYTPHRWDILTKYIYFAGKYRTNCQYLLPIFGIATILICFSLSMVKLGYDLQIGCCDFKSGNFCADWAIGNGICDAQNNFAICGNHDGGDCIPPNVEGKPNCPYNPEYIGDSNCLNHYNMMNISAQEYEKRTSFKL